MSKNKFIVFLAVLLIFLSGNVVSAIEEKPIELFPDLLKLKLGISEDGIGIEETTGQKLLRGSIDLISPKGMTFDKGPITSTKFGAVYLGTGQLYNSSTNSAYAMNHTVPAVEVYNKTYFNDGKTNTMFLFNFFRKLKNANNTFTEKISEISVTHRFNEHQQLLIGQAKRLPIGVHGTLVPQYWDMALLTQAARTFSNTRAFGVRNIGKYKYVDYDIGVYDSTRYMQRMFHGAEFVGWASVKPFANLDEEKYGKLVLGSGLQVGKAETGYTVLSTYLGYDYKKSHLKLEYMHADGYNGNYNVDKRAGGFSSTLLYDLTPKLQLQGRYDVFDPDASVGKNLVTELSTGIKYTVCKQLNFVLNYVRRNKQHGADSNMFLFITRFMI